MRRYFLPHALKLDDGRRVIYPFWYMGRGYIFTPSLADRFFALYLGFPIAFIVWAAVPWPALGQVLPLGPGGGLLVFLFSSLAFFLGYLLCIKWVVREAEPRNREHKSADLKNIGKATWKTDIVAVLVAFPIFWLVLAYHGLI